MHTIVCKQRIKNCKSRLFVEPKIHSDNFEETDIDDATTVISLSETAHCKKIICQFLNVFLLLVRVDDV